MMSELVPGQVRSFSVGFTDPSFDESRYAALVARHLGTQHQMLVLEPQALIDVVPHLPEILDEPMADASIIPTFVLSRFAAQHVKVALGGDGGDELLGGYSTLQAHRLTDYYHRVPGLIRRGLIEPAVARLPVSMDNLSLDFKAKRFVRDAARPVALRHHLWLGCFRPEELAGLLSPDVQRGLDGEDPLAPVYAHAASSHARNDLNQVLYLDMKLYMESDILVKVDRASMANSLEVRVPLLNRVLVDYVSKLPLEYKLHRFTRKYLFREALRGTLPDEILGRKKHGFGMPISKWLRGELRDLAQEMLSEERIRQAGLFEYAYVHRLLAEHMSGRRDNRKPIWTLLVFQMWHDHYLGSASSAPLEAVAGIGLPLNRKPLRVLLLNYEFPPLGGGAATASAQIARHLARRGVRVVVVTSAFRGLPRWERRDGYLVRRVAVLRRHLDRCSVPEMGLYMAGALLPTLHVARRFRPDLLHVFFGMPTGVVGLAVHELCGIPYLLSLRGGDVPGFMEAETARLHRLTRPLTRRVWARAGAVVVNSRGLYDLASRSADGRHLDIVPNGTDLQRFVPALAGRDGCSNVRLLFVGRFVGQKGLSYLLDAIAALPASAAERVRLALVGSGPDEAALRQQARDLGLASRVQFSGWVPREEIVTHYQRADIFVLPSLDEGMPNVVLEAMACGLPVLATAIRGNTELVRQEVNGLLVPPANVPALSQALARLIADTELRMAMGKQSRWLYKAMTGRVWLSGI